MYGMLWLLHTQAPVQSLPTEKESEQRVKRQVARSNGQFLSHAVQIFETRGPFGLFLGSINNAQSV